MLFNSIEYVFFLAIVYTVYRILNHKGQNYFLLLSSYVFYGYWDVRFLFLIIVSTVIDYTVGLSLGDRLLTRKRIAILFGYLIFSFIGLVAINWPHLMSMADQSLIDAFVNEFQKKDWIVILIIISGGVAALIAYPMLERLEKQNRRKLLLSISIVANLSILGFFKYFNFFIENLELLISMIGMEPHHFRLNIILPVGISFYTFQTLSYTIDIYREQLKPTKHFINFSLYVAYFPQLVAGPIERAVNLLPRICKKRKITLDQSLRGLHLILFGFFKKVAIADGVARTVNQVYGSTGNVSWLEIIVATMLFAVQIYCDFSGYSDIARGTSKLLGIELMVNFNLPYFAKNPRDFWARWHISLSTWLRDYLYISMGGNKSGRVKTYRNLMATMVLGGLWHGAAWNFLLWGFYHGIALIAHRAMTASRFIKTYAQKNTLSALKIAAFSIVTLYGWMLFRANSFGQILMFTKTIVTDVGNLQFRVQEPSPAALIGIPLLLIVELAEYNYGRINLQGLVRINYRAAVYSIFIISLLIGLTNEPSQFIYFTF